MNYKEFISSLNEFTGKLNTMEDVKVVEFLKEVVNSKLSQETLLDLEEVVYRVSGKKIQDLKKEEEKKIWEGFSRVKQPFYETFYKLHQKFQTLTETEVSAENKKINLGTNFGMQMLDYIQARYKTAKSIERMIKRLAKDNKDFSNNCPRLSSRVDKLLKEDISPLT